MIRLDTYQRKLQALLGGAVTTNQPTAVVCYTDKENENQKKFFVESVVSTFNNATPVDICPAPDKAMVREIDSIHIRNNDTVAATVTVRVDDNGTSYEIVEVSVAAGETLLYTKDNGWSVISVYGQQTAVFNYIDFVSGTFPDAAQRLKWNDTDGTLEVGLKGGNVNLSVGLEEAIIAKEASNGGIEVGKVYYFVGSDGSNKTVAKARANVMAQAELCLGIAAESSTGGNKAFICTFGLVRNIDTNHLTEGAPVYLSAATAGELTATIPASPNYVVFVGYCIRKSATVGSVFVSINSGTHLEYLHDIKLTSPVGNNQVIIYDSALGYWKNSALSAIGVSSFSAGTTGFTPNTPTIGAVTLGGTLATTNGGTGLTSFTTNGVVYASSTSALATGSTFVFDGTNVGIGGAPTQKLSVIGGRTRLQGNNEVYSLQLEYGALAGQYYIGATNDLTSPALVFSNNYGEEKVRIDSSGNVGIATPSPNANAKLHVVGKGGFSGGCYIGDVGNDKFLIDDASNGAATVTLYIGNASINTTSDIRLKENIVDTEIDAISKVQALRVVDFTWNDPSDTSWNNKNARGKWTGLIAQEAIAHVPWAINAPRDQDTMEPLPNAKDENGKDQHWFMDYGQIVPLLVKAIQELKAEFDAYKASHP